MKTASDKPSRRLRLGSFVVLAAAMLVFTACASAPQPPTAALEAAQAAIGNAELANAGRLASAELAEAREKLVRANDAVANKQMLAAQRLAEESRVTAELAYARTESAKALAVNTEMSRGAEALSEEMQRAGDQR